MSVKLGETGKRIYIITSFDMSSNTSLTIYAVPPSGESNQKTWSAILGGALANVTLEDGTPVTSVAANQSMYYDLDTGDIDEVGDWHLVGVYENTGASPTDHFIADKVTLTVTDDGYSAA